MNITNYVKTLKGVVNQDEVLTSLDSVNQDLTTKVLPIVNTAAAAFKTLKITSTEVLSFEQQYSSAFRLGRGSNIFVDLQERLQTVVKNIEFIRVSIEKTMPATVSAAAIDHKVAMLLQLVDNASFLMRFIRRFVEASVIYETQAVGMYEDYQKENLSKGEAQWVANRFPSFLNVLEAFSDKPESFKKKFDDIPNVKVDINADDATSLFGRLKMDPFKLGFIPVFLNPFFHIGKWIAEFQAWRYKEAQYDLERINKRILLLEESQEGKSNPKIEKELKILRDRSEDLTYKINKTEEDL